MATRSVVSLNSVPAVDLLFGIGTTIKWVGPILVCMEEQKFEVEYTVISRDQNSYDVTFELSEDAEEALFTGLADHMANRVENGGFDGELVHLYKMLAGQQESFPPWFETDSDRTYDLEITDSMYSELSRIIGKQLSKVNRTNAAPKYRELVGAWEDITDQIDRQKEIDSVHEGQIETMQSRLDVANVVKEHYDLPDPETGEFICFIQQGDVAVYENDHGERWYYCTICEQSYSVIGEHHVEACDGEMW